MSSPHDPSDDGSNVPQFDKAEYTDKPARGTFCRACDRLIRDEYYDAGGDVICSTCNHNGASARPSVIRPIKALLFGSVAAVVGAAVYRMITRGTGLNLALVAIAVGYTVGGAVRTGSGERGGRFYQFLAVFLTYCAIVGMFLPDVWAAVQSKLDEADAEQVQAADNPAVPRAGAADKAKPDNGAKPNAGRADDLKNASLLYLFGMMAFWLALFVAFVFATPVIYGYHAPISLFIFALALWQAWKMNRSNGIAVTGPYYLRG